MDMLRMLYLKNTPEPRGRPIILRAFVDSDHANDKCVRQRSCMGFCFFINMACIIWYTKRQATVESAAFGSDFVAMTQAIEVSRDFVAMKQAIEVSRGLRYKLRMMGVPIEGPTHMYGDNMSTIHNTQHLSLSLRRNSTVFVIMLLERQ